MILYRIYLLIFCLLFFGEQNSLHAEMYKWIDANGRVTYSNVTPPAAARQIEIIEESGRPVPPEPDQNNLDRKRARKNSRQPHYSGKRQYQGQYHRPSMASRKPRIRAVDSEQAYLGESDRLEQVEPYQQGRGRVHKKKKDKPAGFQDGSQHKSQHHKPQKPEQPVPVPGVSEQILMNQIRNQQKLIETMQSDQREVLHSLQRRQEREMMHLRQMNSGTGPVGPGMPPPGPPPGQPPAYH
jgi:hypothetical protein